MAVAIRLSRGGAKKRPYYRIVVSDSRSPRDGKYLEQIGIYNPMLAKDDPARMTLDEDRARHWLGVGAVPSDRVHRFLDKAGILERAARNNPKKGEPGEAAKERAEERATKAAAAEEAAKAAEAEAKAPVAEEPATEEPVTEEKTADEDAPAAEAAVTEDAPAEAAPANEPTTEATPAADAPAADAPATDTPAGDAPAEEGGAAETAETADEAEAKAEG